MTCEESAGRMSELLDGVPGDELEAHLGGCPACREGLEGMRRADDALRRLPPIEWPPALTESILRRTNRPARRFLPIAACLAAAAAVAVLLLRPVPQEPDAAGLYAQGRLHLDQGDAARAIPVLRSVVERHPESPWADASCLALAAHFEKAGDDPAALSWYTAIRRPESITPAVARAIQAVAFRCDVEKARRPVK